MKIVLSLLLCFLALAGYSQTNSRNAGKTEYNYPHNIDNKSWAFVTALDTLSAKSGSVPDTVVIGLGDTLFYNYPDTVLLYFPNDLGTSFVGVATINMDNIQSFTTLTGTYAVQTAQCLTCPWTTEASSALPANTASTRVKFEVPNIKMRLMIIGTGGFGSVNSWVTIKPASITKS